MKIKIALVTLIISVTTNTFAWKQFESLDGCALQYIEYDRSGQPAYDTYINLSRMERVTTLFGAEYKGMLNFHGSSGKIQLSKLDSKIKKKLVDAWLNCNK